MKLCSWSRSVLGLGIAIHHFVFYIGYHIWVLVIKLTEKSRESHAAKGLLAVYHSKHETARHSTIMLEEGVLGNDVGWTDLLDCLTTAPDCIEKQL